MFDLKDHFVVPYRLPIAMDAKARKPVSANPTVEQERDHYAHVRAAIEAMQTYRDIQVNTADTQHFNLAIVALKDMLKQATAARARLAALDDDEEEDVEEDDDDDDEDDEDDDDDDDEDEVEVEEDDED